MKIAVWHNLHSGGARRALHQQIRGLLAAGHHVEAWTPNTRDPDFTPIGELVREHVHPLGLSEQPSRADRLGVTSRTRDIVRRMDRHSRTCADEIARGGFDLLFANSCYLLATTSIGRLCPFLPSVLYLQEPQRFLYEALPKFMWAAPTPVRDEGLGLKTLSNALKYRRDVQDARLQVREEIRNARAYGRILCNSFFSRESILRAYGIEAEVCYLGIDANQFGFDHRPRQDYVVGVGAFGLWKNPRMCIEAVSRMAAPRPPLIWISNVADLNYLDEMQRLSVSLGVELDVRVNVTDAELLDVLGGAMAMLYAPRLEPFGLAPLEANARGTPVIAVAEGGVRETVLDGVNGLLVDSDATALAAALDRLRRDPALARRLGIAGRDLIETRWSVDAADRRLADKLEAEVRAYRATA